MLPTAQKNEGERQELGEGSRECSYDVCCDVRWGRRCGCGESSCSLTVIKFMRAEDRSEAQFIIFAHTVKQCTNTTSLSCPDAPS